MSDNRKNDKNDKKSSNGLLLVVSAAAAVAGALIGAAVGAAIRSSEDDERARRREAFSLNTEQYLSQMEQYNARQYNSLGTQSSSKVESCPPLNLSEDGARSEPSSSNDRFTCAICRDPGSHELSSLACGHIFCADCLAVALHYNAVCPTCRQRVKSGDPRRLYT